MKCWTSAVSEYMGKNPTALPSTQVKQTIGNKCLYQQLPRNTSDLHSFSPPSHQFHCGGIWISKQAVFCTGAICWEWVTAAKFMVPLTLNTVLTKLKQAGNRRVNNYPSNIPSWSDRTHTIGQFPSAASFPLPAGYEAFPQMLFLENN